MKTILSNHNPNPNEFAKAFFPPKRLSKLINIFIIFVCVLLISCAKPITPAGGPKDEIPPRIIKTLPENGSIHFKGTQIVFQFSEFVESANLSKDIFITPIPQTAPEMLFKGKKLFITWKEERKENTTYVIQPGKGIRDVNEKNPLDSLFQFAFSTGAWLDSLEVGGDIIDPLSGSGANNVSVLLFSADSIQEDSIFKKRPAYAAQTKEDGSFQLKYLAPGRYLVYGVKEENPNFEYNSLKEALALAQVPLVIPGDSANLKLKMILSLPDTDPPKLRNKTWLTKYLLETEWSEPIRSLSDLSKFSVMLQDTLQIINYPLSYYEVVPSNPDRVRFYLKEPVTEPLRVTIKQLGDTLFNTIDTSFVIQPRKQDAKFPFRLQSLSTPEYSDTLYLTATEPIDNLLPDSVFMAIDTAGKKYPLTRVTEGRIIKINLLDLRKQKISWTIQTDSTLLSGYSGTRADTTQLFNWNIPSKEDYGSISGQVKDSLTNPIQNPVLKIIHKESGKVWYFPGMSFKFPALKPGELQIYCFEDLDSNGRWTPGSLHPYRMPERIYPIRNIPKIRVGWELEDVKMDAISD